MLNFVNYYRALGFNVVPTFEKKAMVAWQDYQERIPEIAEVMKMPWDRCTGIAAISGTKQVICIDFDKSSVSIAPKMLDSLGLPSDYPWVVQSGSGKGWHAWMLLDRTKIPSDSAMFQKNVMYIYPKNVADCEHAEIRLNRCYTLLPPSKHTSGMEYKFANGPAIGMPAEIDVGDLQTLINDHFHLNILAAPKRTIAQQKPTQITERMDRKLMSASEHISKMLTKGSYQKWTTLGFSLCQLGKEGYKYFENMSLRNANYTDSEITLKKKYDQLLRDYNGSVSVGSFFHFARATGWKAENEAFWYRDKKKQITFDGTKFIEFLNDNNFSKISFNSHYEYIFIEDIFITFVQPFFIKDYVISYLRSLEEEKFSEDMPKSAVTTALINNTKLFKNEVLEFLPTVEIDPIRDSEDTGAIYFKNCILSINQKKIEAKDYSEVNGYIYSENVIKKDYKKHEEESVFKQFLKNICRQSIPRYNSLVSSIGFMLHTYKNAAVAKAVIFCDEALDIGAAGRTGKSLVAKAISHIRNSVDLGGRNFNFNDKFSFQMVNPSTQVVIFNDVDKRFPFEKLYNLITDFFPTEKKGQTAVNTPFSKSPKILINTNFSIMNSDNSSLARQVTNEFSNHYNPKFTPVDEFHVRFFDQWNEDEWNQFYYFMAQCLQYYLINGLVEYNPINLRQRKAQDATCAEFYDFMQNKYTVGEKTSRDGLLSDFKMYDKNFDELRMKTFASWIRKYSQAMCLAYEERRDHNNTATMVRLYELY